VLVLVRECPVLVRAFPSVMKTPDCRGFFVWHGFC